MRRLVLIRHGESVWNAEGRVQGQSCAGLSSVGHAQARVTAAAVAAAHPDAHLVTSDLRRTRETAAPLAAELCTTAEIDDRLRERSFGAWERHTREEVAADDPDRWARWLAGEDVIGEVGGETGPQLAARVVPALHDLLAAAPAGGAVLAVTHGGSIWHGLHELLGLHVPSLGGVANASVTEVVRVGPWRTARSDGAQVVLDRWNEVAHLPVELRTAWRPRAAEPTVRAADRATGADEASGSRGVGVGAGPSAAREMRPAAG